MDPAESLVRRLIGVEVVVAGDRLVGRFVRSGTHVGPWRGHDATGGRFVDVAEVNFLRVRDGRIVSPRALEDTRALGDTWAREDTWAGMRQLGLVA